MGTEFHRLGWKRRSLPQTVLLFAALVAAATCGEQSSVSDPRQVAPGHAAISMRPSFAPLAPGGPTITLSRLKAVLTAPNGETTTFQVNFVGDSAVLQFDVPITGASAEFTVDYTAFDVTGAVAFTGTQRITLKPGLNATIAGPTLVYAGPDAGVTAIHITPGPLTMNAGGTATLGVTATLSNGQTITPLVGWATSDPTMVTVDASGAIKAGQSQGSATITATSATGLKDQVLVKVHAPVANVIVTPTSARLIRGTTATATAELRDATNHVIDDRVATWTSSDATVASVSTAGLITGLKIGTATITATAEGKTAAVPVTVVSPLDHIELTPTSLSFSSIKATASLAVKLVPVAGGSVSGLTANLTSSSAAVATVDASGLVTAVGNGTATITAELDGITASTGVSVHQIAISVAVSPRAASVSTLGESVTFTAVAVDAQGNTINSPVVTWASSDPTIATVSLPGSGNGSTASVTAKRAGTVTITSTVDGKSDAVTFVSAPQVRILIVLTDKAQIQTGQTATVSAKLADANGNPLSDAAATFTTTTPNVASVSGNVVSGLSPGVAHIVGTAGTLTGSVDIVVVQGSGGGGTLTVTPGTAEKLPGGTQQFSVTAGGDGPFTWTVNGVSGGNATYGTITTAGFYTAPAAVPSPATFDVCAVQASPVAQGCAHVTISPIPSGGADVIVINDLNVWDNTYGASNPDNYTFWKNTSTFTGSGPRASQTGFMFDASRSPLCYPSFCSIKGGYSKMDSTLRSIGMQTVETATNYPITSIPANIKVLLLVTPRTAFLDSEINVLKQFAAQGGRIIYMGEFEGYFSTSDIAVENAFLSKMGAVARNTGGNYLCTGSTTLISPHQITTGLTSVAFACASGMTLGANDYALFRDPTSQAVIGAVTKIDLTPLPLSSAPAGPVAASATRQPARTPTPTPGSQTGVDPTKVRPKP